MDEEIAELFLRIDNARPKIGADDDASVADLPAGFAVEGRLIQDHRALLAGDQLLDFGAVLQNRQRDAFGLLGLVAEELRRAKLFAEGKPDRLGRRLP